MQALRAALTAAAPGSLPDGALALLEALSGMDSMDVYICSAGAGAGTREGARPRSPARAHPGHHARVRERAGSCGSSHLSAFLNRHGFTTNLQTDTDGLRHCNRRAHRAAAHTTAHNSLCPASPRPHPLVPPLAPRPTPVQAAPVGHRARPHLRVFVFSPPPAGCGLPLPAWPCAPPGGLLRVHERRAAWPARVSHTSCNAARRPPGRQDMRGAPSPGW